MNIGWYPLSLDGSQPPLGFRQVQTIDIAGWSGRAGAAKFQAVLRAIDTTSRNERIAFTGASTRQFTRRKALIGGSAVAATAAGGAAFLAFQKGIVGKGGVEARSIAVLPFENLSGDAAQSYLSDGLTQEIRTALSLNAGLLVLAATSSEEAHKAGGDAISIARKLNVAYLLEGSVQQSGDKVRVATNLTNGRTGFSEWSQRVERRLDDIFAFESEIARTVSNALSVRVATDEPIPGGTRSVKAYEAYLRGKALFNLAKDEATDRQARANYEIAVAADPKFALAHAGLSRVLSVIAAEHADARDLKPLYRSAIAEAETAVKLAPKLAQAHLALGYARFAGFLDIAGARPSYDAAYRYGKGDADIVLLYALYAVRARRFAEARDAVEHALVLDPLNPRTHRAAGTVAYASRRYADAIPEYRKAIELNPDISIAHAFMGDALMELEKHREARTEYEAEPAPMFRLRGLAILEHRLGNTDAARRAFDQLVEEVGDAAMYQQAEVMAQWGQADEAFRRLERARAIGDSGLSYLVTDPLLDPIAGDPRFGRFAREIGFA